MSWHQKRVCDYTCPKCGADVFDLMEWNEICSIDMSTASQRGTGVCRCGVKLTFRDVLKVVETNVEVVE